ncbi:MAG: IclR family transcriptional regulator C-terminal domain-containing protein [Marmoricola sp.]
MTDQTITNPTELKAQLVDVRRQGWAATTDELEVGLTGIAVPVFHTTTGGASPEVVAALGISGPTPG